MTGGHDDAASVETIDMTAKMQAPGTMRGALSFGAATRSDAGLLRALVIAAGIGWSVLFVAIGLRYELQLYADGSIFSYAVAVQDAWAFHWHNISGRLFVYLFCYGPAEAFVELTKNARGGIVVYGFLFFSAQLLGLIATYAADRSNGRIVFGYACLSTACLCPLVFGFPTEMWMAHALFWPTLAVCHYARGGIAGTATVLAALLALVLTHEGAVVFAVGIVSTLLLRGVRDAALLRAAAAFLVAMSIWAAVKATFPPDDYIAGVLADAAMNIIDVSNLWNDLTRLLIGALAGYGIAFLVLRRLTPAKAHLYAAAVVALALAGYWLWFDHALHTENRYIIRTALLIATPALGALAIAHSLEADGRLRLPVPHLPRLSAALTGGTTARAVAGAIMLVMLVHAVETAKFVTAWTGYRAAMRALATGTASDPALGYLRFASSARIGVDLEPAVSVFDYFIPVGAVGAQVCTDTARCGPGRELFWLSCQLAAANEGQSRCPR